MEKLNYEKDVEKTAKEFMMDNIDEFIQSLVDDIEDLNDGTIYDILVENQSYISYTPEDAVFVLQNSKNEETDNGLWEGKNDWREILNIMAVYTHENDVRAKIDEIYKEIYQDFISEIENTDKASESDDAEHKTIAKSIILQYCEEKIEQVKPGTEDEKEILQEWLRINKNVGMRGGYPLGSSYIDARCGVGYGTPEQYEYVETDRKVAKQIPHLSGKYRKEVEEYYRKTFGELEVPC